MRLSLVAQLDTRRLGLAPQPDTRIGCGCGPYPKRLSLARRAFPFKIFSILFFIPFKKHFSDLIFLCSKEKINWWYFFYIVQKLDNDIFFSFEVGLNFLIKACLFFRLKNAFKKYEFFIFFSLIQINIFFMFCIIF